MSDHVSEERLDDYRDGLLDGAGAAAVEAHLAACADCRSELARLDRVLAAASALAASIEPPAEVWNAIRARTIVVGSARRQALWSMRWGLAAAAAAIMVLSSALTWTLVQGRAPAPAAVVATQDEGEGRTDVSLVTLRKAETDYAAVIATLVQALDQREAKLDTATARVLRENIAIIDHAIGEARTALERDPANARLAQTVSAEYRRKIAVLERTLRLSTDL